MKDGAIGIGKRLAEHITAVLAIATAVWWVFSPRINAWADDRAKTLIENHATAGGHPSALNAIGVVSRKVDATAAIAAQTTQLIGLLVCRDAGGLPTPGLSDSGGRCVFLVPGSPPRSVPLANVDELLAEAMARIAHHP